MVANLPLTVNSVDRPNIKIYLCNRPSYRNNVAHTRMTSLFFLREKSGKVVFLTKCVEENAKQNAILSKNFGNGMTNSTLVYDINLE